MVKTLPFDPAVARAHAETFSRDRFAAHMTRLVDETRQAPRGARW
jgi:hypothetical protein